MKKKSRKKLPKLAKSVLIAIISGLIVFISVWFIATAIANRTGNNEINDTLDFLKLQCTRYDNLTAMQDTRSQMQLLDKAKELKRCISDDSSLYSDEFLTEYATLQRMSGIFIINNDNEPVFTSCLDSLTFDDWKQTIMSTSISDIAENPRKNLMASIGMGNAFYDYAVIATPDEDGIIFCYAMQIQSDEDEKQITIENLIAGYHIEMEGIMFITDGDAILSSNNDELQGLDIADCSLLADNIEGITSDRACRVKADGVEYLARASKSSSYYLYVFFPVSEIYQQRSMDMAYTLAILILIWFIVAIIRQNEMHRSNQLKLEFLRRMSHDIRTPINGIRGMIKIANSCPEDLKKQQECRDKIFDATDFIVDLVNDVLDIGKLDSGEVILEPKAFNLHDLLMNISAVMETHCTDKGLTFTADKITGTHWELIGCPVELRRVLTNIISNSIKYNKPNGSVTLSCYELETSNGSHADYVFVCSDTGIGMSREFQKHMFEQFTQENATGEMTFHGTGLGLTIVKSLVHQMHGQLRCESEFGKGTTFYITIPFTINDEQPEADNASMLSNASMPSDNNIQNDSLPDSALKQSDNATKGSCEVKVNNDSDNLRLDGKTILLVEDNEMNMEISEFILEEAGASIIKAWNGQEAVDCFKASKNHSIDAILMDMMMPIKNGEAATMEIRALNRPDATTVPIIAMTANTFDSDIDAALSAGMNEHIAKPIDSEQLIKTIKYYTCKGDINV